MTPGWLITNRGGTRLRLAREWNLEVSSSGLAQSSRGCHMWALNTALPTPHRAAVLLGLGGPHSNHHCPLCSLVLLNPLVGCIKYISQFLTKICLCGIMATQKSILKYQACQSTCFALKTFNGLISWRDEKSQSMWSIQPLWTHDWPSWLLQLIATSALHVGEICNKLSQIQWNARLSEPACCRG